MSRLVEVTVDISRFPAYFTTRDLWPFSTKARRARRKEKKDNKEKDKRNLVVVLRGLGALRAFVLNGLGGVAQFTSDWSRE
jgi:hypothetical protein